jgi:hypothetical protein
MIKKRSISVQRPSKSNFICKSFLFLGIILLIIYVILQLTSSYLDIANIIIAFAILLLGVSGIFYFFHCQFTKLAKIAEEIENEDETESYVE